MNCVIVDSMGRAGSGVLCHHIGKTTKYEGGQFKVSLDRYDYEPGSLLKTHDFPPNDPPSHAKFIWTFADPYEVVISVMNQIENEGLDWVKQHARNLNGEPNRVNDLPIYDALHLEENFDRWYSPHNFDVVTVKYRSIWDKLDKLSEFIGDQIELPEYNPREKKIDKVDEDIRESIKQTYGSLYKKVKEAEDYKEW